MNIFTAQDFGTAYLNENERLVIAAIANEKLEKVIATWPELLGMNNDGWYLKNYTCHPDEPYTHKARLAFVEEIHTESCAHQPRIVFDPPQEEILGIPAPYFSPDAFPKYKFICKHCSVEIVGEWKEKK